MAVGCFGQISREILCMVALLYLGFEEKVGGGRADPPASDVASHINERSRGLKEIMQDDFADRPDGFGNGICHRPPGPDRRVRQWTGPRTLSRSRTPHGAGVYMSKDFLATSCWPQYRVRPMTFLLVSTV